MFFFFLLFLCFTHHTFYSERRVDFIHAAAHLDRSKFCCLSNFESMEFRVAATIDVFCVVLLFGESRCNSTHVWQTSELHTTSTSLSLRSLTGRAQYGDGEHVVSSRDCRDDTEHRGNPNCARAAVLTGNSRGSGGGRDPHLIHRPGPVVKSVM